MGFTPSPKDTRAAPILYSPRKKAVTEGVWACPECGNGTQHRAALALKAGSATLKFTHRMRGRAGARGRNGCGTRARI